MTDTTEQEGKKRLALTRPGRLEMKSGDSGQVRQSFSHGRSKTVQVEVKRKRVAPSATPRAADAKPAATEAAAAASADAAARKPQVLRALSDTERAARSRALQDAKRDAVRDEQRRREEEDRRRAEEEIRRRDEEERRRQDEEQRRRDDEETKRRADEDARRKAADEEEAKRRKTADDSGKLAAAKLAEIAPEEEDEGAARARPGSLAAKPRRPGVSPALPVRKPAVGPRRDGDRRRQQRVNVTAALADEDGVRARSIAALRRATEKERRRMHTLMPQQAQQKIKREVVVPEVITVQELANRMAERGADVIKTLMRMGVMATINQSIDADTAELLVTEMGHTVKRVSEADVEVGLAGEADADDSLSFRPPVVTIMGHVDHGKTSLLDALRETDVAKHEAGGITQHIGAYQVLLKGGDRITFLDTPGHEAFTAMRSRGAKLTDIVVLVVAADDGIQPQTVEAINHAKAASVPMIIAINKVDKPDANPEKVKTDLLQHGVALEGFGGEVQGVEVSALKKLNLDKLEEAILLQAEILDLRANPDRTAQGVVVEAKLERGRGSVATLLVQRGTLKSGDVFVAGEEWGRVRALMDDHGRQIDAAGPAMPVEILGLTGTPSAGDDFAVVESEARAREIASFRQRRSRDQRQALAQRGTLEQMLSKIKEGTAKELAIVVKTDVQGSLEAITGSLAKIGTDEVAVRVLHSAVGAITEGDVALAKASNGMIAAFNVRASPQARDIAKRDGVDIRYYSIIYDIIDDVKGLLSGMLAPTLRERFLGNAEIREIFEVSKAGKVAGCRVTQGQVKRGAKVRLLRDNVVIHEGTLKTLRRFKEEVREVQEGYECGMAFENYQDIRQGDVIECFEMESVERAL
jgi:translation initiation factor IF-2